MNEHRWSQHLDVDGTRHFWDEFAAKHWGQAPVVLRGLGARLGTSDEVLAAAVHLRNHNGAPPHIRRLRAFVGTRELWEPPLLLPQRSDDTLDDYCARLVDEHRDFGLMMMQFQAASSAVWARSIDFLGGLYAATGMAPGGAALDLFVLNQHRGFTGVHKDVQDVFTTVVRGKKRMLLWPFSTFFGRDGVNPEHLFQTTRLGQICDDRLREQAIVLDAEPGDLMYWPADYWHVSEADPEPVVTLGLGVLRNGNPADYVFSAAGAMSRRRVTPPPAAPDLASGADALIAWFKHQYDAFTTSEEHAEQLENHILSRATAFGFDDIPTPAEARDVTDDQWVTGCGAQSFAFRQRGRALFVAVHGHTLDLPAHPVLVRLCQAIAAGIPLHIGRFLDDGVAAETDANRAQARDHLRRFVGVLARYRAFTPPSTTTQRAGEPAARRAA